MTFSSCRAAQTITIDEDVESIGEVAFQGCGVTELTLPGSIKTVGDFVFNHAKSLHTLTVPNSENDNKEEVVKAKKEHRKADLISKISIHSLRHTACTNMAKQGMNIKVLQYLMGHAHSDVTLDVYNHIGNRQDVREEVERYSIAVGN